MGMLPRKSQAFGVVIVDFLAKTVLMRETWGAGHHDIHRWNPRRLAVYADCKCRKKCNDFTEITDSANRVQQYGRLELHIRGTSTIKVLHFT